MAQIWRFINYNQL